MGVLTDSWSEWWFVFGVGHEWRALRVCVEDVPAVYAMLERGLQQPDAEYKLVYPKTMITSFEQYVDERGQTLSRWTRFPKPIKLDSWTRSSIGSRST